jgi:hypothetical protein
MNTRKIILSSLILSLVGLGLGYVLTSSYDLGFCYSNIETRVFDVSCHALYERIGDPLFYGMSALSLVFFFLLFNLHAFSIWKKFAKWYIPLATLIFIFYEGGDMFSPYPEQVFKWVSILYVVISIVLIFRTSLKKE